MSDFLPIQDLTVQDEMTRHRTAASLGLAPPARQRARVTLRPGILKTSLPTKGKQQNIWPRWVAEAQGAQFYRFEDHSLSWAGGAHLVFNGCPVAYHPFNQNALGRIEEQRARGFTGLVSRGGELVRQGAGDPVPGHLVSRTAYQHQGREVTDQRRYLDAQNVPYISVPLSVMLEWKDQWGQLLGSAAAFWDRSRGYRFQAVVGDVDLHGCGGISKYLWDQMGIGSKTSSWNLFEFQVFTGKPFEGYELQRWEQDSKT